MIDSASEKLVSLAQAADELPTHNGAGKSTSQHSFAGQLSVAEASAWSPSESAEPMTS